MSAFDYDLFVIGAGSGGVRAARIAATYGARVAVAEEYRIGGTCVIRGCVPKKLYVYAGRFRDEIEDARGFGWDVGPAVFNWGKLVSAKEAEVTRLSGLYAKNLENSKVEIIRQRAVVAGPQSVRIADGRVVSAERILIATGGAPTMQPAIPGLQYAIDSNAIFDLPKFPDRLVIVGSGYIAVEFASAFARMGAKVTLVFRADKPLRGFDEELRDHLGEALRGDGVDLRAGAMPTAIEKNGDHFSVALSDGAVIAADQVLYATGRAPAVEGLGLKEIGVALRDNGAVIVDATARTNIASIYAVGDVTDRVNLTPVAIREGHAFADRIFGGKNALVDYDNIPTAVFTTPEIGTVGMSEQAARAAFAIVDIYKTSFRPMKATLSGRAERTFMKLVVDGATDKVVGAHVVGHEAGEMAQILAIPMRLGATKADFDATMALHPSAAEEWVTMRTRHARYER
jgi:glutathione reductase (NADPH)